MSHASTVARSMWPSLAAMLLGMALLGGSAHAAQPWVPGEAEAESAPPPAPREAPPVAPPTGTVGFGWG